MKSEVQAVRGLETRARRSGLPATSCRLRWSGVLVRSEPLSIRIQLLGPLEVTAAGVRVGLPARKTEALLAVLALQPGVSFEREWLAALLWPDVPEAQGRTSLRQALGHLRKLLGEALLAGSGDRIHLDPGQAWVDTAELERRLASAPAEREAAAELWRGELLAAFPVLEEGFAGWLGEQRSRLRERAAGRLEECLAGLSAAGQGERALELGARVLEIDPTRELVHRALMKLHATRGDRAAALRQYERCRDALSRALELAPSAETERLRRTIAEPEAQREAPHEGPVRPPVDDGRLVIAVLPFTALSEPEAKSRAELFAGALSEDVSTELSRFRELGLVARGRMAAFDGQSPATIARGTGARLILSGSVRVSGARVRVTAALVDTTTELELWAERWDLVEEDFLGVLDRVTRNVVGALSLRIEENRLGDARRQPRERLRAYECWLRGLDCLRQGTPAADDEARAFFERALELSPAFARAHSGLSLAHFNDWSCQAWDRWDERERLAFSAARRAVELDDSDHVTHTILARIYVYRRDFELGARHAERALGLNANDPNMLMQAAIVYAQLGDGRRASELADVALRLNPGHPDWYLSGAAFARFIDRRPRDAVQLAESAPDCMVDTRALLAAASAMAGDASAARVHGAHFLRNFSEKIGLGRPPEGDEPVRWLLHVNPQRLTQDTEYWLEGLRGAGLEIPSAT